MPVPRQRARRLTVLLCALLGWTLAGVGSAQAPELPPQWFQRRTPSVDGEAISFCVDTRDPAHPADAAIAEALADALLVAPRLHQVVTDFPEEEYETLYFELVEHCAAYLGFKTFSETYPEWLTLTRSYYEARFVLVARNPAWRTFTDIPLDVPIGVVQGTQGDIRFLLANNALPTAQRRPRVPLGAPQVALEGLASGRVQALIVWEPWLWSLRATHPELTDVHEVIAPTISEPAVGVGAVLTADRTFVRSVLDEAIAALRADGTIQDILDTLGFPATAR
jgi:polar amino acid transport system substrate-binding protein